MTIKTLFSHLLPVHFCVLSLFLLAQMPDWKVITDQDGNTYSIDRNRKIYTEVKSHPDYKPVSINSIHYYINLADQMIKSHHPVKGVRLYHSILAMPHKNNEVFKIRAKAARSINQLRKSHGPRYNRYYETAQPFIFKYKNKITVLMPSMRYLLKLNSPFAVIRKKNRTKIDYRYCGILLGLTPDKKNKSYEMLMAIDTEIFPSFIKSVKSYKNNWRSNIMSDTFTREKDTFNLPSAKNRLYYKISHSRGSKGFSGYELIAVNKNRAYVVRIITAAEKFKDNKKLMLQTMKNFVIVK